MSTHLNDTTECDYANSDHPLIGMWMGHCERQRMGRQLTTSSNWAHDWVPFEGWGIFPAWVQAWKQRVQWLWTMEIRWLSGSTCTASFFHCSTFTNAYKHTSKSRTYHLLLVVTWSLYLLYYRACIPLFIVKYIYTCKSLANRPLNESQWGSGRLNVMWQVLSLSLGLIDHRSHVLDFRCA